MNKQTSRSAAFSQTISHETRHLLHGLRHASTHAVHFYQMSLHNRIDYPLRKSFIQLQKLHANLKYLLATDSLDSSKIPDGALKTAQRYQSLALLTNTPSTSVLQYLIETERSQKQLHQQTLEQLSGQPLKIGISAETAMLQITIDELEAQILAE